MGRPVRKRQTTIALNSRQRRADFYVLVIESLQLEGYPNSLHEWAISKCSALLLVVDLVITAVNGGMLVN
jgi:hypothetical protein